MFIIYHNPESVDTVIPCQTLQLKYENNSTTFSTLKLVYSIGIAMFPHEGRLTNLFSAHGTFSKQQKKGLRVNYNEGMKGSSREIKRP